jgi:hypothetical protein
MTPQTYSGERYIWTLAQTATAAAIYPHHPETWEGIEALQGQVALSGRPLPTTGARNMQWARAAFADANARFNFRYEAVPA